MTASASAHARAKWTRWWWLWLVSFAIGVVAFAPAALFEWALKDSPAAGARFVADGGTIWRGQGRFAIASDNAAAGVASVVIPVSWQFDPLSLLRLRLGFFTSASAAQLTGRAHIGLGFASIELSDTAIEADAPVVSLLHSALRLLGPTGKIRLHQSAGDRLVVKPPRRNDDAWRVDGLLGVDAETLAFTGMVNAPVGNHALRARGNGGTIDVNMLRSSGPLKLEGSGVVTLTAPRRVTFSGFATAAADAPVSLRQLGQIGADGRQKIEINAAW